MSGDPLDAAAPTPGNAAAPPFGEAQVRSLMVVLAALVELHKRSPQLARVAVRRRLRSALLELRLSPLLPAVTQFVPALLHVALLAGELAEHEQDLDAALACARKHVTDALGPIDEKSLAEKVAMVYAFELSHATLETRPGGTA